MAALVCSTLIIKHRRSDSLISVRELGGWTKAVTEDLEHQNCQRMAALSLTISKRGYLYGHDQHDPPTSVFKVWSENLRCLLTKKKKKNKEKNKAMSYLLTKAL